MKGELEDPVVLLREWYTWWEREDTAYMPAKLPASLHTRTAIFLAAYDLLTAAGASYDLLLIKDGVTEPGGRPGWITMTDEKPTLHG